MLGNTGVEIADKFYPNDVYVGATEDVSPFAWMFKSSTDTVALLTGNPFSASQHCASQNCASQRTVEIQNYTPLDNRPGKVRKSERKRYKKAKAHYGKTYTVTRYQVVLAIVIWVGSVLLASAGLFQFYIWFADQVGAI